MNPLQGFICSKGFRKFAFTVIIIILTIGGVKMMPELTGYVTITNLVLAGLFIFIGVFIGGKIMRPEDSKPRNNKKSKGSSTEKEESKTTSIMLPGQNR